MLTIEVVLKEEFNDETQEFIVSDSVNLELEHSLASLSEWESKWEKSFMDSKDKTNGEVIDYIRCMLLDQSKVGFIDNLSSENIKEISEYINLSMTATKIVEHNSSRNRDNTSITSELIYHWMIAHQIPFECQYWHLNRLLTLIRICNIKNKPEEKLSRRETLSRNRALNAERRAKYGTKG